jgi:hypothetical protein
MLFLFKIEIRMGPLPFCVATPKTRFREESDGESLVNPKEFRNCMKLAVDWQQAHR